MTVKPFDVVCRCCKAKRGNLCRSRITKKPTKPHEIRWDDSIYGRPNGKEGS